MKKNELKNSIVESKSVTPYNYLLKNDRVCDFLNVLSKHYEDINFNLFTNTNDNCLIQKLIIKMLNGRITVTLTNESTDNSKIYCSKSLEDLNTIKSFLKKESIDKLYAQNDSCFISKESKKLMREVKGLVDCDETQLDKFSFQNDALTLFNSKLGYDKDRPELGKVKKFDYIIDSDYDRYKEFSLLISILEEFSDIFSCIFK